MIASMATATQDGVRGICVPCSPMALVPECDGQSETAVSADGLRGTRAARNDDTGPETPPRP